jgi:hypothetical protein
MDEYQRLIEIQKINDYFASKNKLVMYNPYKLKRTRRNKDDVQWTEEQKKLYRKEYYQFNKERMKEISRKSYQKNKICKGYHTDL